MALRLRAYRRRNGTVGTQLFGPLPDSGNPDDVANRRTMLIGRCSQFLEYVEELIGTVDAMLSSATKAEPDEENNGKIKTPSTRPPGKAFQAWQIRELVGISKQGEIADTMTKQGVPATQGQVSKWLAAVEEWRTAGGLMPEVGTLNDKPQSVDPDILDLGAARSSDAATTPPA